MTADTRAAVEMIAEAGEMVATAAGRRSGLAVGGSGALAGRGEA